MAQFDVFLNPNPVTSSEFPYLLDIQNDLLDELSTRVVVPLVDATAMGRGAQYLNPSFTIEERKVFMSTAELAGIPVSALGRKVSSLDNQRGKIIAALDFLISGF